MTGVSHPAVERLLRDARYSVRALRGAPVFAVVAIVSLALGIGANAAIFQLIDTVRFRNIPVADPEGLVEISAEGVNAVGVSTNFNAEVTNPLWEQCGPTNKRSPRCLRGETLSLRSEALRKADKHEGYGSVGTSSRCSESDRSAADC